MGDLQSPEPSAESSAEERCAVWEDERLTELLSDGGPEGGPASLPTPVPTAMTPFSPPPTSTPITVTITFTCAHGSLASGSGEVCVHVAPRIEVMLASVYYECSQSYEQLPNTLETFGVMPDANGNVTFDWTPTVKCAGNATIVVQGAVHAWGQGGLGRTSVTFLLA